MIKYNIKITPERYKIYLNGILHLSINRKDIITIQSWIEGNYTWKWIPWKYRKKWIIHFQLNNHEEEILEYGDQWKWIEVLKLLDSVL